VKRLLLLWLILAGVLVVGFLLYRSQSGDHSAVVDRMGSNKTPIPDIRSIHTISHRAIAATTMYLIHCAAVLGSVRFS
jgi:hypothetical protein